MKIRLRKAAVAAVSLLTVLAVLPTASAEVVSNPVISRNCPAYSASSQSTAASACDDYYYSSWFGTASDYLAYDLSAVPAEDKQQVIAVWYNNTGAYDYTVGQYGGSSNGMPTDYTIEVNSAEGGAYPESGWETVETVEGNTLHSRQHVVEMADYNWIRIMVNKADGREGGSVSINFDIHNVSDGISDSWIFFGDSITACGMPNCYGTGYATYVNQLDANYFPIQENGGIGGIRSVEGKENIDRWLSTFPGKYVSIAYGTNDAWGNQTGAEGYYENTAYMVEAVIALGKIPVVPKIPYATEPGVANNLADYNAMIDRIYENYPQVVKGPDFEALLQEDSSYLSGDGVHPSDTGYDAMRQAWAKVMYETVYTAEDTTEDDTIGDGAAGSERYYGDADNDGSIGISDVVAVMEYASNRERYPLSPQGEINADVYSNGDGVSVSDALEIQKYLAQIITEFDV